MKKGTPQRKAYHSPIRALKLSLCLLFLLLANAGHASVSKIDNLLAKAEYEQAQALILEMLKQKDLNYKDRALLYWQKAVCHISENKLSLARSAFLNLLSTDPLFEPQSDVSPKILAVYTDTRQRFKDQGGLEQSIQFSFVPIDSAFAGEPIVVQLKIEDPTSRERISRLELRIRKLGNSEYSSLDFVQLKNKPAYFEVTIPSVLTMRSESDAIYEYYVDFFSRNGDRLGGIGKQKMPLTFSTSLKSRNAHKETISESQQNFMTAALWISAATLTVGGIVAAAFAFSSPEEGSLRVRVLAGE